MSQRDVLAWLKGHPGEHTAEEIAEAQGLQVRNIRKALNALAKWREIERLQSGGRFYWRAGAV